MQAMECTLPPRGYALLRRVRVGLQRLQALTVARGGGGGRKGEYLCFSFSFLSGELNKTPSLGRLDGSAKSRRFHSDELGGLGQFDFGDDGHSYSSTHPAAEYSSTHSAAGYSSTHPAAGHSTSSYSMPNPTGNGKPKASAVPPLLHPVATVGASAGSNHAEPSHRRHI